MISTATSNSSLETLAERSPGWLSDLRQLAWERYRALDFPKPKDELWRYTDLSLLRPEQYGENDPQSGPGIETLPAEADTALSLHGDGPGGRIVHSDGSRFSVDLGSEAREAGVILTDLATAAVEHEKLLRPALGKLVGPKDVFSARNLALHQGGTFLHVPRGVSLSAPVQALHWLSGQSRALNPRTMVVVEDGARLVFNDIYSSGDLGQPALVNAVTELYAGEGAQVGWVTWQDWGRGVHQLANVKARLERDARLNTMLVTLGGSYSRTWKECLLAGERARSEMLGLYFSHEEQKFEHWTVQDHAAPNTYSDLLYKGALADSSRAVYYGTIRVRPGARNTDAYQTNRNLNLSSRAKADNNPQLEIENNDVRCSHGATVGKVDRDHLFYLKSRGIPPREAERLLIFGFFNEVLERAGWSGMQELLAGSIGTKLEAQS